MTYPVLRGHRSTLARRVHYTGWLPRLVKRFVRWMGAR